MKDLIKKHSEFISFEINLQVEKTTEEEISDEEAEPEDATKKMETEGDATINTEEGDKPKPKKKKKVKHVTHELEV